MASSSSDPAIPPTPATRGSTAPSLASFARRRAELSSAEPALLEPPPFADGSSSALPPGVRAHVAALHELLRELEAAGEAWVREIGDANREIEALRADPPPPPPSHLAPPAAYKMIATQSSTIEDLKARAEVSRAQIGGLVYEKGRLNQQLRDANSQLERRAEEKTAMVTALGEALKRATAEKDALLKSGKIAPETDAAEKSRLAQIVKSQQRTISTLRDELARARGGGGGGGSSSGDGGGDGGAGTPATASRPPPAAAARPPRPARRASRTATTRSAAPARRRGYDASSTRLASSWRRASSARRPTARAWRPSSGWCARRRRRRPSRPTSCGASCIGCATLTRHSRSRGGNWNCGSSRDGRAAADAAAAAAAARGADARGRRRTRPAPPSAGHTPSTSGWRRFSWAASAGGVGALPLPVHCVGRHGREVAREQARLRVNSQAIRSLGASRARWHHRRRHLGGLLELQGFQP